MKTGTPPEVAIRAFREDMLIIAMLDWSTRALLHQPHAGLFRVAWAETQKQFKEEMAKLTESAKSSGFELRFNYELSSHRITDDRDEALNHLPA